MTRGLSFFFALEAITIVCPFVVGFAGLHARLGWLCFVFLLALCVWSGVLFRSHRRTAVSGFVVTCLTLWIMITLPGYIEARRQKLSSNQAAPPNRRPRFPFAALPGFAYSFCGSACLLGGGRLSRRVGTTCEIQRGDNGEATTRYANSRIRTPSIPKKDDY